MNIGIILPANNRGGPQKLFALMARDFVMSHHKVSIFIPRLPYYYYFVILQKNVLRWSKIAFWGAIDILKSPSFVFQNLLEEEAEKIKIINVLRTPRASQISEFDLLIVCSIESIFFLKNSFPEEKVIYQLHHPEEVAHTSVRNEIISFRKQFKGKIIADIPAVAEYLKEHAQSATVVPGCISFEFAQSHLPSGSANRQYDILVHYSKHFNKGGDRCLRLVNALITKRPKTKFLLWTRDVVPSGPWHEVTSNLSEPELKDLFFSAKIFVFPSTYEGLGMPPIESMSCGCVPVLDPAVGAAPTYAKNLHNSLYWMGDENENSKNIVNLLDNSGQLEKISRNAIETSKEFFPHGYGTRILKGAGFV